MRETLEGEKSCLAILRVFEYGFILKLMESIAPRELRAPWIGDRTLLVTVLTLLGFSITMLYSTTGVLSQQRFGDPLFFVKRQAICGMVGIFLMLMISRINAEKLVSISRYLYPICLIFLALPLLPVIGDAAGGAKRWVALGGFRFQPGEFVKVMYVVYLAGFFARHENKIGDFVSGVVKPFALVGLLGVMFLRQPDFGSTAVLVLVTLGMGAAAGMRMRYIIGAALAAGLALGLLVLVSPYRMARVMNFISPFSDVSGKGYQLIQSLIAVGTGEVFGVGLGEGQQKLFFLPAAHTDFLFAVIGEELGFLGALLVLGLFLVILWRGLRLAKCVSRDTFAFSLAVGLTMLLVVPALLNMGVVLGLLPTKGMVLPLLGYGGSSLISCLVAVGLILSCARTFRLGLKD